MKILSVCALILAVSLSGCGEAATMGKEAAMKKVTELMTQATGLKDMLGKITDGASAESVKDKLSAALPAFLAAKKGLTSMPEAAQKLAGDKFTEAKGILDVIKEKIAALLKNADIKAKLGELLGKFVG